MPVSTGSLSYIRLFVEGELAAEDRQQIVARLAAHVIEPLQPEEDVVERSGWCAPGDPYGLALREEQISYEGTLHVGFRTDRWSIPASLARANVQAAEAAHLAQTGRARLRASERAELRATTLRQLRRQSAPIVRAIDLAWSVEDGVVRFFSHAPRAIAAMAELFERTFEARLVAQTPYTLAARLGLGEGEQTWQALEPTLLGAAVEV